MINSYFDYAELNTLSDHKLKYYDEIIIFLEKKSADIRYVDVVRNYKCANDKVFVYYVLYFFLMVEEKDIDFSLDDKFYLIINCIDDLVDTDYYLKVKDLFKIN